MKKNTFKIVIFAIISIIFVFVFYNNSFAAMINPNSYKPGSFDTASNSEELAKIGNSIIGVLQLIGTILSVSVLIILGIKYAVGSVDEKAQYKKTMVPYVVGAVLVFGITNLLSIVVSLAKILIPTT